MTDLRLDWATHEAAKYACENWHYSKCLPAGKIVKIGIWENNLFIGVVLFSCGATPNLSNPYQLQMEECCELTRVALKNHKSQVSRIVKIAIKLLKKICPKIRLIISFADSEQGHHGGIYQAGNWIYNGNINLPSWIIKGSKKHPRSVVQKYGSQKLEKIRQIDPMAKKVFSIKYRYLMPLDNEIKEKISSLSKPYPKRANSIVVNAPEFHSGKGGAEPTLALHDSYKKADRGEA
jgi:hypothetical protein